MVPSFRAYNHVVEPRDSAPPVCPTRGQRAAHLLRGGTCRLDLRSRHTCLQGRRRRRFLGAGRGVDARLWQAQKRLTFGTASSAKTCRRSGGRHAPTRRQKEILDYLGGYTASNRLARPHQLSENRSPAWGLRLILRATAQTSTSLTCREKGSRPQRQHVGIAARAPSHEPRALGGDGARPSHSGCPFCCGRRRGGGPRSRQRVESHGDGSFVPEDMLGRERTYVAATVKASSGTASRSRITRRAS
jgi:hypothetical protein